MMNPAMFKEMPKDISAEKIADSPLAKQSEGKVFDKPTSEYDKPLGLIVEDELKKKAAEASGSEAYHPDIDLDDVWPPEDVPVVDRPRSPEDGPVVDKPWPTDDGSVIDKPWPIFDPTYSNVPDKNGDWDGEKGDSTWYPDRDYQPKKSNPEGKTWGDILDDYGIDGITFKDDEPDFSEVSKGDVEIDGFSSDRPDNFDKADEELAKQKGCRPEDVEAWRTENKYTWHECTDMKTMQKVPREVHNNINHNGGVKEAKDREREETSDAKKEEGA